MFINTNWTCIRRSLFFFVRDSRSMLSFLCCKPGGSLSDLMPVHERQRNQRERKQGSYVLRTGKRQRKPSQITLSTLCHAITMGYNSKIKQSSQELFQSLAQINVGHRHCVPFSLFPVGPTGLWQIQNALPQLTPGFFVVRLTHGSWCPSQFGGDFLLNSLDQSSLLATGSITNSPS